MLKSEQVRLLTSHDLPLVQRLLNTSEYIYQRFMLEELPLLLKHYPTVGIFNGTSLQGFLLSQTVNAPCAWIGGFCGKLKDGRSFTQPLDSLLVVLAESFIGKAV